MIPFASHCQLFPSALKTKHYITSTTYVVEAAKCTLMASLHKLTGTDTQAGGHRCGMNAHPKSIYYIIIIYNIVLVSNLFPELKSKKKSI